MQDVCHPLLEDPVPNSLEWSPPNGFLVTGSNMSGKTTFIRTIGVNAVLAQTIHTCLASTWEAPMLRVRSCIARTDDLLAGKSYYLVEVEAVLALVHASSSPAPHLFLFDELFRGTNAVERVSAAAAVLTEILDDGGDRRPHLVLAATHDAELIDWLSQQYAACHLGDELGPSGILFTYRLRPGPATTRNAIALLQLHGAPAALVSRALERAAWLDRQRERLATAKP
jgi:DNA mismatch repair ATPase MutS